MTEVVSLFGQPTGERVPSKVAVEVLEDWLAKAKAGECIGVCVVGIYADGLSSYSLAGRIGGFSMLGALQVAEAEIVEIVRGED